MASFLASGATLTLPCSLSRLLAATFLLALGSTVNAQTATAHFSGAMNTIPTVQPSDAAGGIAVDALGNLYVASLAGNTVLKESLSGDVYTESTIPISFVEDFAGLAVDTLGNLYVADNVPAGVLKETLSGGGYIESPLPFGDLEDPSGIAVDGSGNVYLADLFQDQVFKATPSGSKYLLSTVPSSGLSSPNAVAVERGQHGAGQSRGAVVAVISMAAFVSIQSPAVRGAAQASAALSGASQVVTTESCPRYLFSISRAMIRRWISLVPSPMVQSLTSR